MSYWEMVDFLYTALITYTQHNSWLYDDLIQKQIWTFHNENIWILEHWKSS